MVRFAAILVVAVGTLLLACGCAARQGSTTASGPEKAPPASEPAKTQPADTTKAAGPPATVAPEEVDSVLQSGTAEQVASVHYRAIANGQRDLWAKTLTEDNRQTLEVRGGAATFWWDTGRKYVQQYGVYWEYKGPDTASTNIPERAKLFFYRRNADGSERGSPVPIMLILQKGAWRVAHASY